MAWSCSHCTFLHEGALAEYLACSMCGQERESAKRPRLDASLRRLPSHPVTVRRRGKVFAIPDEDAQQYGPVLIERRFLPSELADRLLLALLASCDDWHRGTWTVFGKTHVNARTTRNFALKASVRSRNEYADLALEDLESSSTPALEEIEEAAERVCEFIVNNVSRDWLPTFVFANKYVGGGEGVGWHSDFLMALGPRPVIVGLSLGARRTFCLKSNDNETTVSLPTPHNTLYVMQADAQESWQHAVPKCADGSVGQHAVARDVRFSLTFRMERPEVAEACAVQCKCGRPAALKCSKNGRYYLACNPAGGEASNKCGFWQHCPWAEREAARLRDSTRAAGGRNC